MFLQEVIMMLDGGSLGQEERLWDEGWSSEISDLQTQMMSW